MDTIRGIDVLYSIEVSSFISFSADEEKDKRTYKSPTQSTSESQTIVSNEIEPNTRAHTSTPCAAP
ncbi:hypothetical protein N7455_001317 [Penicillium solitum]|uniref:uncharacterized protein n=1 Tax=Penicillium solitum TaxID=60172 RepID=UPI0017A5417C|nr:hypothetical protein HAV15_008146 [Penicillium sp. str. \